MPSPLTSPDDAAQEIEDLLGSDHPHRERIIDDLRFMVSEWEDAEDRVRNAEDEVADFERDLGEAQRQLAKIEREVTDADRIEYEARGKIMDGTDPKVVLEWALREVTGTEVVL